MSVIRPGVFEGMKQDPKPSARRRKVLRNSRYDNRKTGAYFVTTGLQDHRPLFGLIRKQKMVLNPAGQMVREVWLALPARFPTVMLDAFVVMPNHIHGIIWLTEEGPVGLGDVIKAYKSITTVRYIEGVRHHGWKPFNRRLWERDYWDRLIRDDRHLLTVRRYIKNNPQQAGRSL